MQELHGVIHFSNISESLKKLPLLFDLIWATHEFDYTIRTPRSKTFSDELEFLQKIGFLCFLPPEIVALALKREPTEAMKKEDWQVSRKRYSSATIRPKLR
jgi:hypothetical protein